VLEKRLPFSGLICYKIHGIATTPHVSAYLTRECEVCAALHVHETAQTSRLPTLGNSIASTQYHHEKFVRDTNIQTARATEYKSFEILTTEDEYTVIIVR
jgi:hypothetical protein